MLDPNELARIVEQQITTTVNDQVVEVLASKDWLEPLEQKVIKYSQDKILTKFANSSTMPEIIQAVKQGVAELFQTGAIPGVDQYVDQESIKQAVDLAVQDTVQTALENLGQDTVWLEKIERMINQAVVQRTVESLGAVDINSVIHNYVDTIFNKKNLKNFSTVGFSDRASQIQLTIMDETTVFENELTARGLNVIDTAVVQNLIVKGSINTDNQSWNELADAIGNKTLSSINNEWQSNLVDQVAEKIKNQGIDFEQVTIDGQKLVDQDTLNSSITKTNIQQLGLLASLDVNGRTNINKTLSVTLNRVGINTQNPETALSIWDEEVNVSVAKYKHHEAYLGTTRLHTLNIGVNQQPQITITPDGTTSIKKLRIEQHQIGFSTQVPGWAGVRGDIVFNSNPTSGIFAWTCLGDHNWKVLRVIE